MSSASKETVLFARTEVDLKPAPIEKSWIVAGMPNARNAVIARSEDGQISTIVWDCSAGEFDWHYDFDEAIHILAGEVVIQAGQGRPRRLGLGDVVFFPSGSCARWQVESYVRKIAFCRKALPRPIAMLMRLRNAAARVRRGGLPTRQQGLLGGAVAR